MQNPRQQRNPSMTSMTSMTSTRPPTTMDKSKQVFVPNVLLFAYLGQCSFFALGNSHTMGTADFAGAYTGTTTFSKYTTGVLAFMMVFTGPILSYLGSFSYIITMSSTRLIAAPPPPPPAAAAATTTVQLFMFLTLLVYRCLIMIVSIVVTWLFQHHLFVWSVFAPKFVYEVGQTCVIVSVFVFFWIWQMLLIQIKPNTFSNGVKKTV